MTIAAPTPVHFLVAVGGALVVLGSLAVARAPVTRSTPAAVVPWAVVAACLHHLALQGLYPPSVEPLFGGTLVGPTTFALAGGLWLLLRGVAIVRDRPERGSFLAASGVGAAVALGIVTLSVVPLDRGDAVVLVGVPGLAAVLAAVGYLSLGFVDPPAFARGRFAGYLVAFAGTFDGVASALLVDVVGRSVARPSVELALAVDTALGLPAALGVGWLLVVPRLVGSLVAVALLTRGSASTELYRVLGLALLVATGIGPGVAAVLEATG
jgi:uncharacterized membrane protein